MKWTIDTPCPVSWDSMTQAEQGRECAQCNQLVVDLEKMTNEQLDAAYDTSQEVLCAHGNVDAHGVVIRRKQKRRSFTGGFALVTALTVLGCDTAEVSPPPAVTPVAVSQPEPQEPGVPSEPVVPPTTTPTDIDPESPGSGAEPECCEEPSDHPREIRRGRIRRHPR